MSELSFVEGLVAESNVEGWTDLGSVLSDPSTVVVIDPPRGFALGRAILDEVELMLIVIAPEHRRRGEGRRLLAHFEDEAARAGATVVHLEVAAGNAAARALYAAAGYAPVGVRAGYYRNGDDAHLLTKPLGAGP